MRQKSQLMFYKLQQAGLIRDDDPTNFNVLPKTTGGSIIQVTTREGETYYRCPACRTRLPDHTEDCRSDDEWRATMTREALS